MRKPRHTEEERRAIIARTLTSGRPIAEIAAEEGISRQTIQSWMRAPKRDAGGFIEVSPPRATIVEVSFSLYPGYRGRVPKVHINSSL